LENTVGSVDDQHNFIANQNMASMSYNNLPVTMKKTMSIQNFMMPILDKDKNKITKQILPSSFHRRTQASSFMNRTRVDQG